MQQSFQRNEMSYMLRAEYFRLSLFPLRDTKPNVKSNLKSSLSILPFRIFTQKESMTVLITGATGLIGKEIVKQCHTKGINVHYLTTSKSKLSTETNHKGFYWNPNNNEIDHNCFKGVSAIINMVGASISERWTDSYKKRNPRKPN